MRRVTMLLVVIVDILVFLSITFFVRRGLRDSMLKFLFLVLGLNFLEATP